MVFFDLVVAYGLLVSRIVAGMLGLAVKKLYYIGVGL